MSGPVVMTESEKREAADREHARTAIVEGAVIIDWIMTECMPRPPDHIERAWRKLMLAASILYQPERP